VLVAVVPGHAHSLHMR